MDTLTYGDLNLVAPGDQVTDYRESGEEVTQVIRPMRAATGRVVRRGGGLTVMSLTVVRTHENHVQARAHIREMRRELLRETATEVIYAVQGQGSSSGRLVDCAVQMAEGRAYGVRSFISYTIQGAEEI